MQDRIRGDASRTTLICVDSYDQRVPKGRYYNCGRTEQSGTFQSLTQLLVGMEHILDSANIPQSFTAARSFTVVQEEKQRETAEKARNGELATFAVKILFRQHTSWQGSVTWLEKRAEQPFRSVLELILLMDSALGGSLDISPTQEE